jgi:hypothetical protein
MQDTNLELIISKHEKLQRLLNESELGTLTDFKEEEFQNTDFKAYIQDRYCKSILTIVNKYINTEKEGKVIAAMRSLQYLANDATMDAIASSVQPFIAESISGLNTLNGLVDKNASEDEIIRKGTEIDKSLSNGMMSIYNSLSEHAKVKLQKDEFLAKAIEILEKVAGANPKKETGKYMIFNLLINNLNKINDYGTYTSQMQNFTQKIEKTRDSIDNKYVIWVVIVIVLVILRVLSKIF